MSINGRFKYFARSDLLELANRLGTGSATVVKFSSVRDEQDLIFLMPVQYQWLQLTRIGLREIGGKIINVYQA